MAYVEGTKAAPSRVIAVADGLNGCTARVSAEDVGLARYAWHLNPDGYVVRSDYSEGRKRTVWMHRAVLERAGEPVTAGFETDHINGDRLDNRRENLRVVTHRENLQNRQAWSRHGYKGVVVHEDRGVVQACIYLHGQAHYVGTFAGEGALEDAALARDAYVRRYYAKRSRLNFPDRTITLEEVEARRVPGYHDEPAYVRIDAWLAERV